MACVKDCPKCGALTHVIDARPGRYGAFRRRRECLACGYRYTTAETVVSDEAADAITQQQLDRASDMIRTAVAERSAAVASLVAAEQRLGQLEQQFAFLRSAPIIALNSENYPIGQSVHIDTYIARDVLGELMDVPLPAKARELVSELGKLFDCNDGGEGEDE